MKKKIWTDEHSKMMFTCDLGRVRFNYSLVTLKSITNEKGNSRSIASWRNPPFWRFDSVLSKNNVIKMYATVWWGLYLSTYLKWVNKRYSTKSFERKFLLRSSTRTIMSWPLEILLLLPIHTSSSFPRTKEILPDYPMLTKRTNRPLANSWWLLAK